MRHLSETFTTNFDEKNFIQAYYKLYNGYYNLPSTNPEYESVYKLTLRQLLILKSVRVRACLTESTRVVYSLVLGRMKENEGVKGVK